MNQSQYRTLRRMARIERNRRMTTRFPCYPDSLSKQMVLYARLLNIAAPRDVIDHIVESIVVPIQSRTHPINKQLFLNK